MLLDLDVHVIEEKCVNVSATGSLNAAVATNFTR